MSKLLKNLLVALGIVVVVWIGYSAFTGDPEIPLSSTGSTLSMEAQIETQEILAKTQKLNSFSIDNDVLNDERFVSLTNFRVDLLEEPVGRVNPFATVQ